MKTPTQQNSPKPYDVELRARLIAKAVLKPVQRFMQFDFDEDYDFGSGPLVVDELRRTDLIRLHVPIGTSKDVVLAALEQFKKDVEKGAFPLDNAKPYERTKQIDEFLKETALLVLKLAAVNPLRGGDCELCGHNNEGSF